MNEEEKQCSINTSSLVALKAELARKKEQFRLERIQHAAGIPIIKDVDKKKSNIWSKKNRGVLERAQKDAEEKREEEDVLDKSRKQLEAKAKLYEQMTKNPHQIEEKDDEEEGGFLVDFHQKAYENLLQKRAEERTQQEAGNSSKEANVRAEIKEDARCLQEPVTESTDPDEQWVDYVDGFSRSRRCMKKDLPELKRRDEEMHGKKKEEADTRLPDLMSSDMHREILREKWEKEEEEMLKKSEIHYTDVLHDEKWNHGVGYYRFAKEEEERKNQFETLNLLRQQTVDNRASRDRIKEKRKALMKARLAKVKQRRMIQQGKDPNTVQSDDEEDSDEDTIGPKLSEKAEPEPLKRDESLRENKPTREWDKGKKSVVKNWLEERREERVSEFAPPTALYGPTRQKPQQYKHVEVPPPTVHQASKVSKNHETDQNDERQSEIRKQDGIKLRLHEIRAKTEVLTNIDGTEGVQNKLSGDNRITHPVTTTSSHMTSSHLPYPHILPPPPPPPPLETSTSSNILTQSDHVVTPPMQLSNAYSSISMTYVQQASQTAMHPIDISYLSQAPPPPPPSVDPVLPPNHQQFFAQLSSLPPPPPPPPSIDLMQPPPVPSLHHQQYTPLSYVAAGSESSEQTTGSTLSSCNNPQSSVGSLKSDHQNLSIQEKLANIASSTSTETAVTAAQGDSAMTGGSTNQSSSTAAAPQPVHYGSAPVRETEIRAPRYERVHVHTLPSTLPAPPSASNIPLYPSQEKVHGVQSTTKDSVKNWLKQYQYSNKNVENVTSDNLKTPNIPFLPPNVQKKEEK